MSRLFGRRLFIAGVAGGFASLYAQESTATFSSAVRVVNVLATVRTKDGKILQDLTKDDFAISEEGRPQSIRYFSRESNLPLELGLLVDTSGSQRNVLHEEVDASYRFLDQVMREKVDSTFVIRFDFENELMQDPTMSKDKLRAALDEITGSPGGRGRGGGTGRGGGRGRPVGGAGGGGAGTTLYDAVFLASDELMRKREGRKALIVLTDGVDHGSKKSLNDAIEAAQRADTLVYSIMFEGQEGSSRGANGLNGRQVLQRLSLETGAGYFEVSKKRSLADVYRQLEEELRNQYSLGFTPESAAAAGFRRLKVTTKRKGALIQARSGYYPVDGAVSGSDAAAK